MVMLDEGEKVDCDFEEQTNNGDHPVKQRALIGKLLNEYHTPKWGETWCLIDMKWWNKWKKWVEDINPSIDGPGPIDNSHLLISNSNHLRKAMIQDQHFKVVHEKVWGKLSVWYPGGPLIARKVSDRGGMNEARIDLFPIFLKWGYADDSQPDGLPRSQDQKISLISRWLDVKELHAIFEQKDTGNALGVMNEVRLNMRLRMINMVTKRFPNPTYEDNPRFIELTPEEHSLALGEFTFDDWDLHLVVAQKKGGEWSFKTREPFKYRLGDIYDIKDSRGLAYEGFIIDHTHFGGDRVHYINWGDRWNETFGVEKRTERFFQRSTYTNGPHIPRVSAKPLAPSTTWPVSPVDSSPFWMGYDRNENGKSMCRGIVGLENLGNTCYMNSTLQCLMQSPWLNKFFLDDSWRRDLNRANPLGKGGRVAEEYAALLQNVFSDEHSVIDPKNFKSVIELDERFCGWGQQDSQELLAFLLDGLHEDLNRVKDKLNIENVQSNGREDNIVANEAWTTHLKRNDSIIVDKLYGQFRSKLACPSCGRTSVTFEPFMYLTVPVVHYRIQPVTIVLANGSPPKKYGIKVLLKANIGDLKKIIGKKFRIDLKWILLLDIYYNEVKS